MSYQQGLEFVRQFLNYSSDHTVEDLQAFSSQRVPVPRWVKVINVSIPQSNLDSAAELLQAQLGPTGIAKVGGKSWWQWRPESDPPLLHAEWVEMREDYVARKQRVIQKQKQTESQTHYPRKKQHAASDDNANGQEGQDGEKRKKKRQQRDHEQQEPEEYERIMLYVHGGAYYFSSVDGHRYQIQRHARKLRARVLAPRYRLAPQFPFPCALQDCLAAYLYLIEWHRPSTILLAGDSAGAGTILSTLVILRDQGIPLPAGGILFSPWVDLTHSFPSLGEDSSKDYIPASGFMHKPSASWPPFTPEELAIGTNTSSIGSSKGSGQSQSASRSSLTSSLIGDNKSGITPEPNQNASQQHSASTNQDESVADNDKTSHLPSQAHEPLRITIDGKTIEIKDQIQLYAPNHLLNHPLVSPILQSSLGGLPPLLIQVGGGEILRDEQIYLAHKAADPSGYPPSKEILDQYDPNRKILHEYKPTDVQLQVWDDMCHVPHTFSFSNPAKLMYKAGAQFGAWALLKAQREEHCDTKKEEDKTDASENVRVCGKSSDKDRRNLDASEDPSVMPTSEEVKEEEEEKEEEEKKGEKKKPESKEPTNKQPHQPNIHTHTLSASTPHLPPFNQHMIRQCVSRQGLIRPLPPPSELPALQLDPSEIGVVKEGPVLRRWLEAQKAWTAKHGKARSQLLRDRVRELEMHRMMDGSLGGDTKGGDEAVNGAGVGAESRNKDGDGDENASADKKRTEADEIETGKKGGGYGYMMLDEDERPPTSALVGRQRKGRGGGRGRDRYKGRGKGNGKDTGDNDQESTTRDTKKGVWGNWGSGWWSGWS